MTILTVEDEFLVSEYLGEILRQAGYHVVAAENADEAIAILESRRDVRMIITDINMPGSMDGLKLAAAVRDRWPPIKIIIASAMPRPAYEKMPHHSQFLPKPFWREPVLAAVSRAEH